MYRKYKEMELEDSIHTAIPTATIHFSLRSDLFEIVPTWHL